jgi:L-idonate 5-dehydrogenase
LPLCLEGKANHCLDMRFYGSAMRMPHVQGGFREVLVCSEAQAVSVPDGLAPEKAAFAKPLSVCLHAARQAGSLLGKRVLVTGTGPIGALAILVARQAGAREVIATDITDAPLALARRIGADVALTRPAGVIIQLGLGCGDMTLPVNLLVSKEISLRGTFRFHEEFAWAVEFLATGKIDASPLLTEIVPLSEAVRAFELAADRTRAMKVQLAL